MLFLVTLAVLSLSSATASVAIHTSQAKNFISYLISQGEPVDEYGIDLIEALPFHLAFVVAAAASWAGIMFRNAVGFLVSLLSQVAMLTSYWCWGSWTTMKRGGELAKMIASHLGPYGSNIFTTTMVLPLSLLFICEVVILAQVLWSARPRLQSSGS
jgi:hypothetical protein